MQTQVSPCPCASATQAHVVDGVALTCAWHILCNRIGCPNGCSALCACPLTKAASGCVLNVQPAVHTSRWPRQLELAKLKPSVCRGTVSKSWAHLRDLLHLVHSGLYSVLVIELGKSPEDSVFDLLPCLRRIRTVCHASGVLVLFAQRTDRSSSPPHQATHTSFR
jgi:hypothetical protein